jgi:hypothetical protein
MTDTEPDPIGRLIPIPGPMGGGSPPPDLQRDYAIAHRVAAELESRQVNLHFGVDSDTGRVRIELIGGSGEVLREVPAMHLLDALSGCGALVDEQT